MNTTVFHHRRAERFAQLVEEANGGRRHHVRTHLDDQLAELVAIGHGVSTRLPTVDVDPRFRAETRAILIATAEREGIGLTAAEPAGDTAPVARSVSERRPATRRAATAHPARATRIPVQPIRDQAAAGQRTAGHGAFGRAAFGQGSFGRGSFRRAALRPLGRVRTRGAIVVGIAIGAIAVSGMSAASNGAVPGDALYSVKRSAERAQLALASSDLTKGQLYLDFARTRLAEAATVRRDASGYSAVLDDMDADTRRGVRLLHTAAVDRRNPVALDAVEAFTAGQRRVLGSLLDDTSGSARGRTLTSLALLEAVSKREDALRTALSCGTADTSRADAIGPRPRGCAVDAIGRSPASATTPTGAESTGTPPEGTRTERPVRPARPGNPPAPAPLGTPLLSPGDALDADPVDSEISEPGTDPTEDDGVTGDLGRILGGILD